MHKNDPLMKHILTLLLVANTLLPLKAQVLIDSIPYPGSNLSFWGIEVYADTIFLGADGPGDIVFSSPSGAILGQLATGHTFNHGLVRKPNSFLIAQDYTTNGASLFEIGNNGEALGSWLFPDVNGGHSSGIGDLCADGEAVWYTLYYPDNDEDPYATAYKWIPGSSSPQDSVPLHGEQPYGIALKGDTLFYVTDNLNGDPERICAYDLTNDSDIGWVELPDTPIDNDMSPRGMHYDGSHLFLIANRQGGNAFAYQTIYIYAFEASVGFAERINKGSALVYPNPSAEQVTLEWPITGSTATVMIVDASGRLVHQERTTSFRVRINVAELNAGTYHFNVAIADKMIEGSFVVQH